MGNPMPHKNLWLGAAAFQELCRKGFEGSLVIVGSRDMELPQGPGRVIRAEALGDDLLAALHSGALGTLFPSQAEGFGLPPPGGHGLRRAGDGRGPAGLPGDSGTRSGLPLPPQRRGHHAPWWS